MSNEFYIHFDTKSMPGKMLATKIVITQEIIDMKDPKSSTREFRISLCDHPFYKRLQEYVKGNPR